MPLLLFVFARRSLYATYSLPYSCSSVKIRANQHFAGKTTFQTTAYVHTYGTTLARICQNPHQARVAPRTSHTHAPTRPPVHPTMPSTRHLSLTSQLTNTSPAHMQPGIHQSRPPPNVLRFSHYHHNQNTLTSQLKHPPAHMPPIPYQSHPPPDVTSCVNSAFGKSFVTSLLHTQF